MEKTPEVGQSSEASYVSWHFLNPQFHICPFTALFPGAGEKVWGDNKIHKSPTEVPGCGLGCLEISQMTLLTQKSLLLDCQGPMGDDNNRVAQCQKGQSQNLQTMAQGKPGWGVSPGLGRG